MPFEKQQEVFASFAVTAEIANCQLKKFHEIPNLIVMGLYG
jgi:hypothetical protein